MSGLTSCLARLPAWRLALAVALTLTGCGGNNLNYAPASGQVTRDGQPLDRAEVALSFDGEIAAGGKPAARGVTDADGRFTLKTLTPQKTLVEGAVVGHHHVAIQTKIVEQDAAGRDRIVRAELLPAQYTDGATLTAEIPAGGKTDLGFDLHSK